MIRWRLYDPVALDSFQFSRNPASMTSLAQPHSTKSLAASPIDGNIRALRAPDHPFVWSFSGKLRTKADYDTLLAWTRRPNRVQITDHFGRVHELMLTRFLPTPVDKSGEGNPWFFAYTIDCLYFRRVS